MNNGIDAVLANTNEMRVSLVNVMCGSFNQKMDLHIEEYSVSFPQLKHTLFSWDKHGLDRMFSQ